MFPKNENLEAIALEVQRLNCLCDEVIENKDLQKSIFDLEKQALEMESPNEWNINAENNMEKILEVDFAKFALSVCQNIPNLDMKTATVFEYYTAVDYVNDKNPKKQ